MRAGATIRGRLTRYAAAAGLLGALAGGAGAQEEGAVGIGWPVERGGPFGFGGPEEFRFDLRRGRMGITVDLRADAGRDSVGARVAGVTPGGPADRAGVQTGDLITAINGTPLARRQDAEDGGGGGDPSRPAVRLLHLAWRLEPGDTVRVDLRRGTADLTYTFVTEESDMDLLVKRGGGPMVFRFHGPGGPTEGRMGVLAWGGAPPGDLELVKVNPGLGEYFGTSQGLLVVDAGSDTSLGLRAGDVILAIGGRRPTSPSHALRILSTYEGDEKVEMHVMRQRRRLDITGRMPAAVQRWHMDPEPFDVRRLDGQRMDRMLRLEKGLLPMEGIPAVEQV
ncbi:MAG: PDZ domain-containing protein [Candidatus Latescibacterota bacterium]